MKTFKAGQLAFFILKCLYIAVIMNVILNFCIAKDHLFPVFIYSDVILTSNLQTISEKNKKIKFLIIIMKSGRKTPTVPHQN